MFASINGHFEIVKYLVEVGTNIEAKDRVSREEQISSIYYFIAFVRKTI